MPFSIKRLTQVHRSTSLPNKSKQSSDTNGKDKKNKSKAEPSSSSLSSSSQSSVGSNKQKIAQIPGSRSIDAAEIRRLGGQLAISNPIPINQPQVENNSKPIRWSKTGPHSAPRNLQQIQQLQQQLQQQQQQHQQLQQQQQQQRLQQQDIHRSGYYSDAEDVRTGGHHPHHQQQQQRRVMTLIRPAGHQPPAQSHQQQQTQTQQSQPIRMTQQLPNLALLKSGGTNSGRSSSGATTGPLRPVITQLNQSQSGSGGQQHHPQRPASATPLERFVYQPSSALFDDDPGIMSEIETSATGFRRGGKVRSSLPIVRTPSKTQDRSLGLVFLQFRSETKRALLPNEITSLDTVKALFVRSFPRQLSMEYLDCPSIRIYIHDGSKDMFYELEDLRDIRDRCVLRIYEHGVNGPQPVGGQNLPIPWTDSEQFGYFSEPEFESEYQSQHIHRTKRGVPIAQQQQQTQQQTLPTSGGQSQYYGTIILPAQYRTQTMSPRNFAGTGGTGGQPPQPPERSKPFPGYSQTLPRNAHIMSLYGNITNGSNTNNTNQNQSPNPTPATAQTQRSVSPDLISKQRPKDPIGQMISSGPPPKPQRSFASRTAQPPPRSITSPSVVGPQYHQNRPLPDRPYSVAGQYPSPERGRAYGQDLSGYLSSPERRMPHENQTQVRASFSGYPSTPFDDPYGIYGMRSGSATPVIDEEARVRMQAMERQIVSLTNVVTKALAPNPNQKSVSSDEESDVETNCDNDCNLTSAQIQRQQFKEEKSVSFSDETTSELDRLMHSPQRAAERPAKPAIKSRSTLITDKSGKPAPPPKPAALVGYRGDLSLAISNDMMSQLRQIRKKTKDLRGECRSLRRLALQQTTTAKETLRDTCNKIKATLSFLTGSSECQFRLERMRISAEKDFYGHDVCRLDKDLQELESQVEELRSNVINRRCRVNMSQVESMALVLSRASKTVADLKNRFPPLSQSLKTVMSQEMECCVREEKFLKEEPEKLETALKRCKKLTGTLVTLKRLASVQEQRSTTNANSSSPLLQSASTDSTDASRAKRIQSWRRSPNFVNVNNHKIDLWRGFASMPAMPEHNENQMYDSDLEPHTIIQVTPATPSAIDSAKTNVLDTLLDELQTFSKPSAQTGVGLNNNTIGGQSATARKLLQSIGSVDSSVAKKGPQSSTIPAPPPRSSSRINPIVLTSFAVRPPTYSSIRSNSEPNAALVNRPRSTPPEGITDGADDILVPPSSSTSSLSSVGSQSSVVEKRFAQSRQELLEQRHQELLKKQRQLQEQYTRLQQLSRGQIPRGLLNDLKKTGSESNIVSKTSINMSAVHGSLRDLANKSLATNGVSADTNNTINSINNNNNNQQKIFETDIL